MPPSGAAVPLRLQFMHTYCRSPTTWMRGSHAQNVPGPLAAQGMNLLLLRLLQVSGAPPSPLSMPHASGFGGARCRVNIQASAGGGSPTSHRPPPGFSDSPPKRSKLGGLPQVPTPTPIQRSIYEVSRQLLPLLLHGCCPGKQACTIQHPSYRCSNAGMCRHLRRR